MDENEALELLNDLEKRLDDLCWIHDQPALYLNEHFYELRNRIDFDTEEHLDALKYDGNGGNIELSRVRVNNVRSEFIRLLNKIEDDLLRTISASDVVSSLSSYGRLKQRVEQFKDNSFQGGVDLNSVKYAYSLLVLEILAERNELEKRLFCNQTIIYMRASKDEIYMGANKEKYLLGCLIYLTDIYLSKEQADYIM